MELGFKMLSDEDKLRRRKSVQRSCEKRRPRERLTDFPDDVVLHAVQESLDQGKPTQDWMLYIWKAGHVLVKTKHLKPFGMHKLLWEQMDFINHFVAHCNGFFDTFSVGEPPTIEEVDTMVVLWWRVFIKAIVKRELMRRYGATRRSLDRKEGRPNLDAIDKLVKLHLDQDGDKVAFPMEDVSIFSDILAFLAVEERLLAEGKGVGRYV